MERFFRALTGRGAFYNRKPGEIQRKIVRDFPGVTDAAAGGVARAGKR
jgi:hypothetical protein